MSDVKLHPSVMCADLVNLERDIKRLEKIGVDALHIDVIDGKFSPSMPIGIETIARMREITNLDFDIHLMTCNNEFFIGEMLKIGVQSITFPYETSLHVERNINIIKSHGVKASISLNPATSISNLEFIYDHVDMITLMLINPGFAGDKNEGQVPYAIEKINKMKATLKSCEKPPIIQVDGRVSLEKIPSLVSAGAESLVLGSTSLFRKGYSIEENKDEVDRAISKGKEND
ncbi:ribulose-phosphate 3-epimerase [Aerococcus loyolae]|nr:ribulose phosphate epimerase [Aerococcus loyolae]